MLLLLGNSLAPTLRDYFKSRANCVLTSIGKYSATQSFAEIIGNAEGQSVVFIQSLGAFDDHSTNDFEMQSLQVIHELKRPVSEGGSGAKAVWFVAPYAGKGRQDRKVGGRNVSLGLDTMAVTLKAVGADGFTTVGLHSTDGLTTLKKHFGEKAVFDLSTAALFAQYIKKRYGNDSIVVGGPDAGANERADRLRSLLKAERFQFKKEHTGVNDTIVVGFEGEVSGATTITVDDEIDTGGTVKNSQTTLRQKGASKRIVCADHAVFSQGGLERLFTAGARADRDIHQLIVTDTIDTRILRDRLQRQYDDVDDMRRIQVLSIGSLLWKHIQRDIAKHPVMQAEMG